MVIKKNQVVNVLKKVFDPELGVSVWDLGLIYGVAIDPNGNVNITMTLTSIGCPLYSVIESEIVDEVSRIRGVRNVSVELTFEPLWNMEKISSAAKKKLGI